MSRFIAILIRTGLVLSLVGAVAQLVVMLLDVLLPISLRWYWGGAIAFFVAPVAFALTATLLRGPGDRDVKHA